MHNSIEKRQRNTNLQLYVWESHWVCVRACVLLILFLCNLICLFYFIFFAFIFVCPSLYILCILLKVYLLFLPSYFIRTVFCFFEIIWFSREFYRLKAPNQMKWHRNGQQQWKIKHNTIEFDWMHTRSKKQKKKIQEKSIYTYSHRTNGHGWIERIEKRPNSTATACR